MNEIWFGVGFMVFLFGYAHCLRWMIRIGSYTPPEMAEKGLFGFVVWTVAVGACLIIWPFEVAWPLIKFVLNQLTRVGDFFIHLRQMYRWWKRKPRIESELAELKCHLSDQGMDLEAKLDEQFGKDEV